MKKLLIMLLIILLLLTMTACERQIDCSAYGVRFFLVYAEDGAPLEYCFILHTREELLDADGKYHFYGKNNQNNYPGYNEVFFAKHDLIIAIHPGDLTSSMQFVGVVINGKTLIVKMRQISPQTDTDFENMTFTYFISIEKKHMKNVKNWEIKIVD